MEATGSVGQGGGGIRMRRGGSSDSGDLIGRSPEDLHWKGGLVSHALRRLARNLWGSRAR
jgi:hypothetical protein